MRNKHALKWVALASAIALSAAGCANGASGDSGGKVKLTWWQLAQEEAQHAALADIEKAFEEANPTIDLVIEERATDAQKDALRTAIGTDAAPDIYFYWEGLGLGGELVDMGASLDLTKYYEQYGWKDRFGTAALSPVTAYGGYHGVPWTQRYMGIYYNKELLAKAGVTEFPTTYQGLKETNEKLAGSGVTPFAFGGAENWHLMRLMDSIMEATCGAEKHDKLKALEVNWGTEPCVADAYKELKQWGDTYLEDGFLGIGVADAQASVYAGRAAMALEPDSFTRSAITEKGMEATNVGVAPFPADTGRGYGFGEANYISATSKHPDKAAKFLDFLTSDEVMTKHSGVWGSISVNKAVKVADPMPQDTEWETILKTTTGLYNPADQALPLDATTEFFRIENAVVAGEIQPGDAGAAFQKFVESR